jgi:ABC-type Fe3+ transport system permease subunit
LDWLLFGFAAVSVVAIATFDNWYGTSSATAALFTLGVIVANFALWWLRRWQRGRYD